MDTRSPIAPSVASASIIEVGHQEIAETSNVAAGAAGIDPACSQEPIRIPGTIQPHGAMLIADPSRNWAVVAASRNIAGVLALPSSAGALGRSVGDVLGLPFIEAVQGRFQDDRLRGRAPWQSTLKLHGKSPAFDVAVHSHGGLVLVEVEPAGAENLADAQTVVRQLQEIVVDLRETGNDLSSLI